MLDSIHLLPSLPHSLYSSPDVVASSLASTCPAGGGCRTLCGLPESGLDGFFWRPQTQRGHRLFSSFEAPEEERREPTWPLMLVKYYKSKVKEMEEEAQEAALKKVQAERDAFRAHDEEEVANQRAAVARAQAAAVDAGPDDTIQEVYTKILYQGPKEDAVSDQVVASEKLLDADDRRDAGMNEQIHAMQKEAVFEQKLRAAMAEQKMRSERRNLVPGVTAVDCSGRQIMTKETCDAEDKAVFRDGQCVVAGGENPPDSPEELGAAEKVNKDAKAIADADEKITLMRQEAAPEKRQVEKKTQELKTAQLLAQKDRDKLSKDSKGAPFFGRNPNKSQDKRMQFDKQEISKADQDVQRHQNSLNKAKATYDATMAKVDKAKKEDKDMRAKHVQDLNALLTEEDKVEEEDIHNIKTESAAIDADEKKFANAQQALANTEKHEAKVFKTEEEAVQDQANARDGLEQVDLQKEAGEIEKWKYKAQWEGQASAKGNQMEVVKENIGQSNAYVDTKQAQRDAERDAYSRGATSDPTAEAFGDAKPEGLSAAQAQGQALQQQVRKKAMDGRSLSQAQRDDNNQLKGELQTEMKAKDHELDALNKKADAGEERNGVSLREAETKYALKQEADHAERTKSSALAVAVTGWPYHRQQHLEASQLATSQTQELLNPWRATRLGYDAASGAAWPMLRHQEALKQFL